MRRSRTRRALLAATLAAVLSAGGLLAYDATGRLPGGVFADGTGAATQGPGPPPASTTEAPAPAADAVLGRATARPHGPSTSGISRVLGPLLRDRALGRSVGATVVDATTGRRLYARGATSPRTPASVAKLLTGAAALSALDARTRLATTVVAGEKPGDVVLVGGGDPTLTASRRSAGAQPRFASLDELARRSAATLRKRSGTRSVRVRVDTSLFSGPTAARSWPASYLGSDVVAPITALGVDGGRLAPDDDDRAEDPAADAGARFAAALRTYGVKVARAEVTRTTADRSAAELARVESPPVPVLVERMLTASDNELAEALLRHVAIERGEPATFDGGADAATAELDRLGVPTAGLALLDGSGLSRANRVPPAVLAAVLRLAAGAARPELRALLSGLPVAGFSGTLADRYGAGRTRAAAGVVRAKTGTLTGVSALAGTVVAEGRLLLFVVMSDRVPAGGTLDARERLDRVAAALAACGCH